MDHMKRFAEMKLVKTYLAFYCLLDIQAICIPGCNPRLWIRTAISKINTGLLYGVSNLIRCWDAQHAFHQGIQRHLAGDKDATLFQFASLKMGLPTSCEPYHFSPFLVTTMWWALLNDLPLKVTGMRSYQKTFRHVVWPLMQWLGGLKDLIGSTIEMSSLHFTMKTASQNYKHHVQMMEKKDRAQQMEQ